MSNDGLVHRAPAHVGAAVLDCQPVPAPSCRSAIHRASPPTQPGQSLPPLRLRMCP